MTNIYSDENRQKALNLINAFYDEKDIIFKDPECGVHHQTSIYSSEYWNYLVEFCKSIEKYKIIDN